MFSIQTLRDPSRYLLQFRKLQNQASGDIGQVSPLMLEKYAALSRLHVLTHDDTLLGYVIASPSTPRSHSAFTTRILVASVEDSVRRKLFGTMLIDHVKSIALRNGDDSLGLWCAVGVPATDFWKSLGFRVVAKRFPTHVRRRVHNGFFKEIAAPAGLFPYDCGHPSNPSPWGIASNKASPMLLLGATSLSLT